MSHRRDENSGLIDLDALSRRMDDSSPAVASAPAAATAPAPSPGKGAAEDSLEGIAIPEPKKPEPKKPVGQARATAAKAPPAATPGASDPAPAEPSATSSGEAPTATIVALAAPRPSSRRIGLVAGLIAAALAAVAVVRVAHAPGVKASDAPHAVATSTSTTTPKAAATAPLAPVEATPTTAGIDPASLPAPAASAEPARATTTTAAVRAPVQTAHKDDAKAVAPATLTERDLAPAATGASTDLGSAMSGAVGPRATTDTAAPENAAKSGARQLRPSPGAVLGALNAVLPAARQCLGPDGVMRSGTVVFRSDGAVARVDLRGEKPEDGCVRAALSKARVEPFSDDTFATNITVRP